MARQSRAACAKLTEQTGANSLVQQLEECKKIARQYVLLGARGPIIDYCAVPENRPAQSVDWPAEKQAWCRGVR
jgi:hypothetical protein